MIASIKPATEKANSNQLYSQMLFNYKVKHPQYIKEWEFPEH